MALAVAALKILIKLDYGGWRMARGIIFGLFCFASLTGCPTSHGDNLEMKSEIESKRTALSGESVSPFSEQDVLRLQVAADGGNQEAREQLITHYLFMHDDIKANEQIEILFSLGNVTGISHMSRIVIDRANQRSDRDPQKLIELRSAVEMRNTVGRMQNISENSYDGWLNEEIRRIENLQLQSRGR